MISEFEDIKQECQRRNDILHKKQIENDLLGRQIAECESKIIRLAGELSIAQEALGFIMSFADQRRGTMKGKIESVISEAVQLIYGKSYRVELSYSVKNNRSCLEIEMVRDIAEGEVRRDMVGFGGGMSDTISVPLRLMVLLGSKQTDRVCVLDECWKHMDLERIELVGKFLRLLTDKLGMQIIMCSHHERLRDFAERTYEVTESDGVSSVEVF